MARNCSGGYLRGRDEGITRENVKNRAQHVGTVIASGGEIATDSTKNLSASQSAKCAGDFLLDFHHAERLLGKVVVKRDAKVVHKS